MTSGHEPITLLQALAPVLGAGAGVFGAALIGWVVWKLTPRRWWE